MLSSFRFFFKAAEIYGKGDGNMTRKEALTIFDEFEVCFVNNKRTGQYIGATSLTNETMLEWEKSGGKKNLDKIREDFRKQGKDPDAWCIAVHLKDSLIEIPKDVFPSSFKGLNVYIVPPLDIQEAH
jgi:hypothetical protein